MAKYTAIIIEPRQHKALFYVLNNFLTNLSDDWGFVIFHGNNNYEYVKNIVNNLNEIYLNREINLINLNVDNLTNVEYTEFLKKEELYSHIDTETFLIFQTDSMILKENKDKINLFLHYDYVGAPWCINKKVGNGGFSLRKKTKMLEIIKDKGDSDSHDNEDYYFSLNIHDNICYCVPEYEEAQEFSVETVFYLTPFGIHNCWKYLDPESLSILINKYPEIQELIDLQH
jgi:hypothetical protein